MFTMATSDSTQAEAKFVEDNIDYIEEFFSKLSVRESDLPSDIKSKVGNFKNKWSAFFGSHDNLINEDPILKTKHHASKGAIPKRKNVLNVEETDSSADDGDLDSESIVSNFSGATFRNGAQPPVIKAPDFTQWWEILKRMDPRKLPDLEKYDEERGQDLSNYFNKFEEYCQNNFKGNRDSWIGELGKHLQGKSLDVFLATRDVDESYDDLKNKLLVWYQDMKDIRKEKNITSFKNVHRNEEESMHVYAARLQRLFRRAYPSRSVETSRSLQEKFMSTVPKKFRNVLSNQVMSHKLKDLSMTWSAILKCARHFDLDCEKQGYDHQESRMITVSVSQKTKLADAAVQCTTQSIIPAVEIENNGNPSLHNNSFHPRREIFPPVQRTPNPTDRNVWRSMQQRPNPRGRMQCSHCGRLGHDIDHCRERWNLCFICGSDAHFLRQCPEYNQRRSRESTQRSSSQPSRVSPGMRREASASSLVGPNQHLNYLAQSQRR